MIVREPLAIAEKPRNSSRAGSTPRPAIASVIRWATDELSMTRCFNSSRAAGNRSRIRAQTSTTRDVILDGLWNAANVGYPLAVAGKGDTAGAFVGRLKAQIAVGHPQDPLAVVRLGLWRDDVAVGQDVIHRRKPGGRTVADPGDLDRRRFAGEHEEAVVGGMAGKVEEHVDPVRADLLGQSRVACADHVSPERRGGLKPRHDVVLNDPVRSSRPFRIGRGRDSPGRE